MAAPAAASASLGTLTTTTLTSAGPTVAAVPQTVPASPIQGSSISSPATDSFPLAAIVCIAIVGGALFLFVVYRLYRWVFSLRQQKKLSLSGNASSSSSPTSTQPFLDSMSMSQGALMTSMSLPLYSPASYNSKSPSSTTGLLYPSYRNGSGPKGPSIDSFNSFTARDPKNGHLEQHDGSTGGTSPSDTSPPSPASGPLRTSMSMSSSGHHSVRPYSVIRGDSSMSTDQLRAQGSRASVAYPSIGSSRDGLAAARQSRMSTASMVLLASQSPRTSTTSHSSSLSFAASHIPASASRTLRLPGPPYARHSRIEIVPPAPLGPPLGTVVATDKTTLAFSALSGIGHDDTASRGGSAWFQNQGGQGQSQGPKAGSAGEMSGVPEGATGAVEQQMPPNHSSLLIHGYNTLNPSPSSMD